MPFERRGALFGIGLRIEQRRMTVSWQIGCVAEFKILDYFCGESGG